jgi:hypothetical protein
MIEILSEPSSDVNLAMASTVIIELLTSVELATSEAFPRLGLTMSLVGGTTTISRITQLGMPRHIKFVDTVNSFCSPGT